MSKLLITGMNLLPYWRMALNLLLATMIGYNLVQLILSHFATIPLPTTIKNSAFYRASIPSKQSPLSSTKIEMTTLFEAQLFGKAKTLATSEVTTTRAATLPSTLLQLKLQGIYYTANPLTSRAAIAAESGDGKFYREKDTLPGGAILIQIHRKQVILSRNGQSEILQLMDTPLAEASNAKNVQKPIINQETNVTETTQAGQLLGHYQQELRTDPSRLMKLVRLAPVNEGNRFVGYRIDHGKDRTLLAQFNLQPGDILTSVNGISLDSPLKGLSIVQQLATSEQVQLQVLRHGQPLTLSFTVEPETLQ
jgi:general secretion pathway protein C